LGCLVIVNAQRAGCHGDEVVAMGKDSDELNELQRLLLCGKDAEARRLLEEYKLPVNLVRQCKRATTFYY
jgi:hypothetical protein